MRIAVIGYRTLMIHDLENYLPPDTTEIISGGAKGVDSCAREYALAHGIKLTEFLPEYERYGHYAPIRRNEQIIRDANMVLAFWDGKSTGTAGVVHRCGEWGIPCTVVSMQPHITHIR